MGYKSEQFLRIVDENLFCSICHEVFQEPVSCKDGHTFCSECIEQWLKTSRTCPLDNTVITDSKLVRNLTVSNIVDNLYVYCIAQESENNIGVKEGNIEDKDESELKCDWTGKLQSLAKHKETCPFQQVQCPNMNCNTNMQRRELEDHDKMCEYKELKCDEQCGVTLIRRDLLKHKRIDCPEVRLPCPNGCEISIKRKNITTHKETCLFQQVQCPNVNCNTNMQRRELEDHDKICRFKMVLCDECRIVLIRHELEKHHESYCPETLIACPNNCTFIQGQVIRIKRIDLIHHMTNSCAKTILDCPFKDQGCSIQVERQHMDKHVQDNMAEHMMSLAKQCSSLTKQNSSLTEQNTTLTEQCSALTTKCSSLTKECSALTKQCSSLTSQFSFLNERCSSLDQRNVELVREMDSIKSQAFRFVI